jgi:intraflagellar transport protein 46
MSQQRPNNQIPLPKFNISEFEKLTSNPEYKSLLSMMNKFQPAEIPLDTKLKPFIPSYIPSIGEVDAFLKVHKPDKSAEDLGLSVIDEPTIEGVDPDTFILKLIYFKKNPGYVNHTISSLSNAEKNPKQIQNWIDKIGELPKMSGSVPYSKNMPDIESLMQIWPDKMEAEINETKLPDELVNLPTDLYAKIICNLLDIPIHKINTNKALIEALHVLFSLYSVVKENQAYKNIEKAENVQSIKFS